MGKVRSFLFLSLLVSSPSWAEETYACFKQGIDNPKPRKLVISAEGVEWFLVYQRPWQINTEQDFCNASHQYFNVALGIVETNCFNREEATLYNTHTEFGATSDGSSITVSWRCIAVD